MHDNAILRGGVVVCTAFVVLSLGRWSGIGVAGMAQYGGTLMAVWWHDFDIHRHPPLV